MNSGAVQRRKDREELLCGKFPEEQTGQQAALQEELGLEKNPKVMMIG